MTTTQPRSYNHIAITNSGVAHYADDTTSADGRYLGHTLACSGRTTRNVAGMPLDTASAIHPDRWCKRCAKIGAGL